MQKITIPTGSKIDQVNKDIIQIRVPHTKFWVIAQKIKENCWNAYLSNPQTRKKELIKENISTLAFIMVSNLILKTPFPYEGKRAKNPRVIKKFLIELTKNTHDRGQQSISSRISRISRKTRKVQSSSKRKPQNESHQSKTLKNRRTRSRHQISRRKHQSR